MNTTPTNSINFLKVFNYLGAALVFFGIAFFIGANWFSLNTFLKIFTTLGTSIAAYLVGIFLLLEKKHEISGSAFFMISALTLPLGLFVTTDLLIGIVHFDRVNVILSAICLLVFFLSHRIYPRTIFLLFSIIFFSIFYLSLITLFLDEYAIINHRILDYEFLVLGVTYLCLGRYLDLENKFPLSGPLYFFGALFILWSSYSLGGNFVFRGGISEIWKVITALLILGAFLLSVPWKSKSFLYLGAFFLVFYLTDLSARFIDLFGSFGWPLILILVGFLLMFTGYLVMYIHKKINRK